MCSVLQRIPHRCCRWLHRRWGSFRILRSGLFWLVQRSIFRWQHDQWTVRNGWPKVWLFRDNVWWQSHEGLCDGFRDLHRSFFERFLSWLKITIQYQCTWLVQSLLKAVLKDRLTGHFPTAKERLKRKTSRSRFYHNEWISMRTFPVFIVSI